MKSVAVLTGATGGLGHAFMQELLREELDEIWAVARDPRKLETLCAAFGKKVAGQLWSCMWILWDFPDDEQGCQIGRAHV